MTDARGGATTLSPSAEFETDHNLESAALAGAAAVQQLIAERNNLRGLVSAQQRELDAIRTLNGDLRRRINLIRHHYVELASKVISHLEKFQQSTHEAMRESDSALTSDEANLIALAQRLRRSAPSDQV